MQTPTETALLDQLKNEQNASFELLYRLYFPTIAAHITRNSGSRADAEDIFQETIIVLLQQVRKADFVLTASLKTYLFAIARNLWLNRLRAISHASTYTLETCAEPGEDAGFDQEPEPDRANSVADWLTKITRHCQQILNAIFFQGETIESLMQTMGWKNKHTAANQQYKCIQQVKKQKDKK